MLDISSAITPSNFRSLNLNHFCPLCSTTSDRNQEEEVALINYLNWRSEAEIAAFYLSGLEITEAEVKSHALAYGWDIYRARHTKPMYEALMREAMPHLITNANKLTPKDFVKIAKQHDVITGQEIGKQQHNTVFNERAVDTTLAVLTNQLSRAKDPGEVEAILKIFSIEFGEELTEIYKRKNGMIGPLINKQDIDDYRAGKLDDTD